jgi:hypothetical protein
MMWLRFLVLLVAALICKSTAFAEEPYLDDRSSAETLIRSLYNAINHHEYARAWSYYADPPAKDFATYSKGFESTAHVDVLIGEASGDGAAGSIFFNVPVAIRAKDNGGKFSAFAGCYVLRQVNGPIQEPPFTPLHIQSAKLKPIKADDFARYSLPKCGDPPPDASSPASTIETAKAKFIADAKGECDKVADTEARLNDPEVFAIQYKGKGATPGQPENKATLYAFSCMMAAYNETSVFYLDAGALGLARVSFARPHLDIAYADAESAKLKSMRIDGYEATSELTNAAFDPKTNAITEFSKWRGIGDASSSGTWTFQDGQFVLQDYAVDPTFDGEQNPIDIFAKGQVVLKP